MTKAASTIPTVWRNRALGIVLLVTLGTILGLGGMPTWVWIPAALVAGAGACALAWSAVRHSCRLPWYPLLAPAVVYGGLVAWQWAWTGSVDRAATLTAMIQLALFGCVLYLALVAQQSRRCLKQTGWVLWLATGALGGEAIWQYFTSNGYIYWIRDARYGTPVGPFVYHNHFAGMMDLLLPVAIAVALRPVYGKAAWVTWIRRGLMPALGLAAVVVSQSRGGVVALGCEAVFGLALLWHPHRPTRRETAAALVGIGIVIGLAALVNTGQLWHRFDQLAEHDPSAEARVQIAYSGLAMYRDHALTGVGLGGFATAYPLYARFDNGLNIDHAHDEYVEALAETGTLGALLAVGFVAVMLGGYFSRRRQFTETELRLRSAALIGCGGFLVHCAMDFEFHAPGLAALFMLCCAMAYAPGLERTGIERAAHAQRAG